MVGRRAGCALAPLPGGWQGILEAPAAGTVTAGERSAALTAAEGCGEPWPWCKLSYCGSIRNIRGARDMARKELVVTQDSPQAMASVGSVPGFDASVANAARMWNYWIGGKHNFSADS